MCEHFDIAIYNDSYGHGQSRGEGGYLYFWGRREGVLGNFSSISVSHPDPKIIPFLIIWPILLLILRNLLNL